MAAARGITQLLRRALHNQPSPSAPHLDVGAKDLASDEALWALYKRWCSMFEVPRSPDEMASRFNTFKETARYVHDFNQRDKPYTVGLNMFADLTTDQFSNMHCGVISGKSPQCYQRPGFVPRKRFPTPPATRMGTTEKIRGWVRRALN